jgi:guanosine-3',5'-bis(diphosphate) 3'-pyrophosphohydrolase
MMDLQAAAEDLARKWHSGQCRKGVKREPFIEHPLRVADILKRHGIEDERILSAAILHDVLEDSLCPPGEIESAMSPTVLGWVRELTDNKHLLKSERKQMQVERAELLSPEAKWIRLADKIDNVGSLIQDPPRNWSWIRQREYVAWANRVVKHLGPCHPGLEVEYADIRQRVWARITGQDQS